MNNSAPPTDVNLALALSKKVHDLCNAHGDVPHDIGLTLEKLVRVYRLESERDALDEYQSASMEVAIYPNRGNNLEYATLGLCGEAGEFANKVKKIQRDGMKPETRDALIDELGDSLWYIAAAADELKVSLSEVARRNVEKLRSRKERGVIQGAGDTR